MRLALLLLLLAALSWPALAQQEQTQPPPAQNPPPQATPAQPSTPVGAHPPAATEPPPSTAKAAKKKAAKKKKKRSLKSKKSQGKSQEADAGPHRIVVRHGGTSDTGGQLEPGVTSPEAAHQRQSTERLLEATDANLKNISQRKLTSDQQDMVRQITFYMEQSRSASKQGDLERARNLAMKAHMLSDELAHH